MSDWIMGSAYLGPLGLLISKTKFGIFILLLLVGIFVVTAIGVIVVPFIPGLAKLEGFPWLPKLAAKLGLISAISLIVLATVVLALVYCFDY